MYTPERYASIDIPYNAITEVAKKFVDERTVFDHVVCGEISQGADGEMYMDVRFSTGPCFDVRIPSKEEKKPSAAVRPRHVYYNGDHTCVIWNDGTKTVVGVGPYDEFDQYAGFCAALAKKLYGSSAEARKMLNKVKSVQKGKIR